MNDFENGFTLQLFHLSDQEANTTSTRLAPNLSAVLNTLRAQDIDSDGSAGFADTLTLSSGDVWIPGLFYDASEDIYGLPGAADILIQHELGVEAVAFGNHEFDNGTEIVGQLLSGEGFEPEGDVEPFGGAAFPYLSGNLGFSADENLAPLVTGNGQDVADIPGQIAEYAVAVTDDGERIGIVASTTPAIDDGLTSPGDDVAVAPDGLGVPDDAAGFDALAATIQEDVDALLADNPDIDKVILLSHQQVLSVEQELATRLSGVDIIVAGGSNAVLLDGNDQGFGGEAAAGAYPGFFTDADGNPVAVVNTDAAYQYLGRLVIDFDDDGVIVPDSYDPDLSGAFATDDAGLGRIGAAGNADPEIVAIAEAVEDTIVAGESNFFAVTEVFLNAERDGGGVDGVRTQETNLGNLTADANLFYVRENYDETVVASFKNGGGIRANIGQIVQPGGGGPAQRVPPEGVEGAKPEGGISQNDVADTLAFNNGLTLLDLNRAQLLATLESTVANYTSLEESAGDWGQFGGIRFSFDPSRDPGDRVIDAAIVEEPSGEVVAEIARDGEVVEGGERFRIVTLNFLADGGNPGLPVTNSEEDGFDEAVAGPVNRRDLAEEDSFTGPATFAPDGSEQDALAEYLLAEFGPDGDTVDIPDTTPAEDQRIQNLDFRDSMIFADTGVDFVPVSPGDTDTSEEANVALAGNLADATLTPIEGGFSAETAEGSVDLIGVESIRFDDATLEADMGEAAQAVYLHYQVALDRAPDLPGITFWTGFLADGSLTGVETGQFFVDSEEFGALIGGGTLGDEAFVDTLIERGDLGDAIDGTERDAFVADLAGGTSRGEVLFEIATSDEAVAAYANEVDDGVLLLV
ncbi:MAG: 5'-nucleotidase C-terminal domain-containing protein [Paracoccaceae bacterium]